MSIKTDLPSESSQQQQSDVELARPLVNGNDSSAAAVASPRNAHTPRGTRVASPQNKSAAAAAQEHDNSKAAHSKVVSSCLMYSFCSVSMVLTNKSLASR
jgi:hypothetical protein